jgi:hypothetical protein
VYVVQLPKSACLVFEVAPEVDVRRSMGIPSTAAATGAASAAGSHGQPMQYHDIVRIWVSLPGDFVHSQQPWHVYARGGAGCWQTDVLINQLSFLCLALLVSAPQLISLDEGRVREALDTIGASYRKGQTARRQLLLEAQPLQPGSNGSAGGVPAPGPRLPLDYRCQVLSRAEAVEAGWEASGRQLRRYFPPASTEADSYTVLKFHPLEDSMLHAGGI